MPNNTISIAIEHEIFKNIKKKAVKRTLFFFQDNVIWITRQTQEWMYLKVSEIFSVCIF